MLHGGGVAVHAPGEGWEKRAGKMHPTVIRVDFAVGWEKGAGKMPHGRVTFRFLSRDKALTQDGRRAGGQAGSGNDLALPAPLREGYERAARLQFRQEKMEGGQHGGQ